ncbi:MAG: hypothetical protein ACRD0K_19415 [Egibacteraceae bacterium]
MGKRFLRSIVQEPVTLSVTGEITPVDLPVNPVSMLYLTLFLEEPAQQVAITWTLLSDFFAAIDNIRLRHKGQEIIQGTLADIMMLNGILHRGRPHGTHFSGIGNNKSMTFPISLSRVPYWHDEAFPATSRGNLTFSFNVLDITPGTATALQWALEVVELIEDTPTRYLKYTTNTRALTATGRQRVPLPLGNEILGVLLFDPSTEIAVTETFAWGKVKLMKDNVEQYYAESNWESLRGDIGNRVPWIHDLGHVHVFEPVAGTVTSQEQTRLNEPPHQYGYLDFDPLKDGSFSLETEGASDVELDLNSDVSTGTARYLPVELVAVR